ncbi:MAG: hypothetical protein JWN74_370 [Acidobacteriaceae bacterium]|nr:hypothetical protein [Acidobacteriaceae bacterium]
MYSYRIFCIVSLVVLFVVIAGCGGGGHSVNYNNVTVTLSPAVVTVPANGQVTLQATVNGSGSTTGNTLTWSIAEQQTNGASGSQCFWSDTPPAGPCPDGTIQLVAVPNFQTVTYHAPNTSGGPFHVIAEWFTIVAGVTITKDGTSAITVSP